MRHCHANIPSWQPPARIQSRTWRPSRLRSLCPSANTVGRCGEIAAWQLPPVAAALSGSAARRDGDADRTSSSCWSGRPAWVTRARCGPSRSTGCARWSSAGLAIAARSLTGPRTAGNARTRLAHARAYLEVARLIRSESESPEDLDFNHVAAENAVPAAIAASDALCCRLLDGRLRRQDHARRPPCWSRCQAPLKPGIGG